MEQYDATGGGKYAGSAKNIGWDIGTGAARTTGGTPMNTAPSVGWDIGTGSARTTGPAPAPTYAAPSYSPSSFSSNPAPYIPPVQGYQAPAQSMQQSFAPPPPPPPPAPPVGGRQWYNGLDQGAKSSYDQSQLATDSDYTQQMGEYDKALKTFIDRIATQKLGYDQDAKDATASTDRNQAMSLDQLGEDFGARGLSYSGLAVDSADKTNSRFNEAKGQIGKVLARNNSDADMRQADYQTENDISKQNALRSATSRQAQRQALIDSMAGF